MIFFSLAQIKIFKYSLFKYCSLQWSRSTSTLISNHVDHATSFSIYNHQEIKNRNREMHQDDIERNNWLVDDSDPNDGDFQLGFTPSQNSITASDRTTRSMVGTHLPNRIYAPGVSFKSSIIIITNLIIISSG